MLVVTKSSPISTQWCKLMILKRLFIIITEELVLYLEHYIIVFVISYVYLIANEKHFFSLI